jgi:hypothetical protein
MNIDMYCQKFLTADLDFPGSSHSSEVIYTSASAHILSYTKVSSA